MPANSPADSPADSPTEVEAGEGARARRSAWARRWWRPAEWARAAGELRGGGLDLLYPRVCLSCGEDIEAAEAGIAAAAALPRDLVLCAQCVGELDLFGGPACLKCGVPFSAAGQVGVSRRGGCVHCDGRKLWFDETIAAGAYEGLLRQLVLRTKHPPGEPLAMALGRLVTSVCRERLAGVEADVVAPVPMHWRRRLARGTNSAAVLAEVIAKEKRVSLGAGLLRRLRHTAPQFDLTPPARWNNVRQAFCVRAGYHLSEAHVILVDDILTTGATCSEAARALRKAGAQRVTVVVVARAVTH